MAASIPESSDYVEDLTVSMKRSLSKKDLDQIEKEFDLGYRAFSEIQNLNHVEGSLRRDTKDLLQRGIVDTEVAASVIVDIQNTIFHSH